MKWTVRELAWFAATCALVVCLVLMFIGAQQNERHAEAAYAHADWAFSVADEANARLRGRDEALMSVVTQLYDTGRLECSVDKRYFSAINIGSPDPNAQQPFNITMSDIATTVACPSEDTVVFKFTDNQTKEAP